MNMKPFYYIVFCADGFKDFLVSIDRLRPGVVREIPDSLGVLHKVQAVYPACKHNYDSYQVTLKARRA